MTAALLNPDSGTSQLSAIENFLKDRYEFRFNNVKGRPDYKVKGASNFSLLKDYDVNSMWLELNRAHYRCPVTTLVNLLNSSFTPEYEPFLEYLAGLPKWDECTDHIQLLAATVRTTNDDLWQKWFRKWLVALVGSLWKPEIINHGVIVLAGGQGSGKTTWLEKLVPTQLRDYMYSGTVDPNNKDTLVHLAECMLINLDELENLSKSEIGSLKSLITQGTINIRRPYARSSEKLPRRASFAGSINSRQFLNDATGSRRFLCADVLSIDNEHVIIEPDLVFSQAFSLFKQGYQYWFDSVETEEINSNNCQYQVVSPEEEALLLVFQPARQNEASSLFLTTTEIAGQIRFHHHIGSDAGCIQRLGKALVKNHFCRGKKSSQIYKYWVLPQLDHHTIPTPIAAN